jgi:hypothetical protein
MGCYAHTGTSQAPQEVTADGNLRIPVDGFVPTSEVAVQIAGAVLVPIYGQQRIERQLPLVAELQGDVWIVEGTLPSGTRGGVVRLEISKRDARILHRSHGR